MRTRRCRYCWFSLIINNSLRCDRIYRYVLCLTNFTNSESLFNRTASFRSSYYAILATARWDARYKSSNRQSTSQGFKFANGRQFYEQVLKLTCSMLCYDHRRITLCFYNDSNITKCTTGFRKCMREASRVTFCIMRKRFSRPSNVYANQALF